MSTNIPAHLLSLGLLTLATAVLAAVALARVLRTRRQARQRMVEEPNSHYTSQLALERDARHRWHSIDLARIHEINRGEVENLLAKVEATGVEALRPNERSFLDHMAELAGTDAPVPPRTGQSSPAGPPRRPDPREAAAGA